MVVGFITTCAISACHHYSCEFEPRSWRGVLDTTLCNKVCQWLATGRWFSPIIPVSNTNKTDSHDITEILLKVALTKPKPPWGSKIHIIQTKKPNPALPLTINILPRHYSTEPVLFSAVFNVCLYLLSLEMQLSEEGPINRLNSTTLLCPS
jgi:hypothetical protein